MTAARDDEIAAILRATRTIALVGFSMTPARASHDVGRYLVQQGFCVVPVNPRYAGETALGETVLPDLASIPPGREIDMVDIFRRSEQAGATVDEAIAVLVPRGLRTVWMQLGVVDEAAATRARAAGLAVVMDLCPKIEWRRITGEP